MITDSATGKICNDCGQFKPYQEFSPSKTARDKHSVICKPCATIRTRKWRESFPGGMAGYAKRVRQRRYERGQVTAPHGVDENYYHICVPEEEAKKRQRQYYKEHRDEYRQYNIWYNKTHPQDPVDHRIRQHNYMANQKGLEGRILTKDWIALCESYGCRCLACGKQFDSIADLTIDHIKPKCQHGTNTIDNVQPLCWPCNRKKHKQTIDYRQNEYDEIVLMAA